MTGTRRILAGIVLLFACVVAAADKPNVVTSPDRIWSFVAGPPSPPMVPYRGVETGFYPISNNIGTAYPLGAYWCCGGVTISGEVSDIEAEFWEAAAFTPARDAVIAGVVLALGYVSGTDNAFLNLHEDANGIPGAVLRTWTIPVSELKPINTCCSVVARKDVHGIPVKGGQQYWLSVTTGANSNAYVVWNLNDTDQVTMHPSASAFYGVWTAHSFAGSPAFAILGKKGR